MPRIPPLLPSLTTHQGRSPFLKLPAEIRNLIYRELFVGEDEAIEVDLTHSGLAQPTSGGGHLSAQFLRTCRQIYLEGRSVLWGCNTWRIRIDHPSGRGKIGRPTIRLVPPFGEDSPWPRKYMRYFHILIYTQEWCWGCHIRDRLSSLSAYFQSFPQIHELHLELVASYDAADGIPSGAVAVSDYRGRGPLDITRQIKCITTWMAGIRGVAKAKVTGLPSQEAEFLTTKWKSNDPQNSLPEMLKVLEMYALPLAKFGDIGTDLVRTLDATEDDDMETFKACRERVREGIGRYFEEMGFAIYCKDPMDGKAEESATGDAATGDPMTDGEDMDTAATEDEDAAIEDLATEDEDIEGTETEDKGIATEDEGTATDDEDAATEHEDSAIANEDLATEDAGDDGAATEDFSVTNAGSLP